MVKIAVFRKKQWIVVRELPLRSATHDLYTMLFAVSGSDVTHRVTHRVRLHLVLFTCRVEQLILRTRAAIGLID